MEFSVETIGVIRSCFKEKFAIPRQPGLVPAATATLELQGPYARAEAVAGLEDFSHLWVVFVFHRSMREQWRPTVRPPRLGGNRRVGVFASRSNFRPNPIGLSVVKLERVDSVSGRVLLHLSGVDLLDGTPVLDIKPYLPYADALPEARGGFAPEAPNAALTVVFSEQAAAACQRRSDRFPGLRTLIEQLLRNDARPAYYAERPVKRQFGTRLYDFDLHWEIDGATVTVVSLEDLQD